MTFDSVDSLLEALRRLELFVAEQVEEIARELKPLYQDPVALAEYLVSIDWLTPYQMEKLFEGAWEEVRIGPYQLLAPLGEGGVGEVFKAWDTVRGRVVALKVLRQDLTVKDDAIRQFQQELLAVTLLSHVNIIKTYDAHQMGRLHYFAMEYVEGIDLSRYVAKVGPLPVDHACEYIRQVAQGLQHAHQSGLVHRDIKPANLFLIHPPASPREGYPRRGPEPVVKIIDWGLARLLPGPGAITQADAALDPERGMLLGTADYIAPEQARDASLVDTRGDIYSLGCTFYYLLTGRPPFPGGSVAQKLMRHWDTAPQPIQQVRPDVPDELVAIIDKMMAKNPENRQQIPLLVVATLRHFCPGAAGLAHSVIRGTSGAHAGTVLRPPSTVNISSPASETTSAKNTLTSPRRP